jgi:hypothetical protein
MAEEVQGPIISVGASFEDLRQKRNDFRNAIAEYRTEVAAATSQLHDDQRAMRDADSVEEGLYYKNSIDSVRQYLDAKREAIVNAQKEITAITQQVPSLPLKVEVTGVGHQAIEALSLIRDQFGELLGPLNGVTGRISSLIETFKLLGQIGAESTAKATEAAAVMAASTEAEGAAAVAAAAQTELFGAALNTEAAAADRAAVQSELFTASLGELAVAEKAGAVGTLDASAAMEAQAASQATAALSSGELIAITAGVVIAVASVALGMFEAAKSTAELAESYQILAARTGVTAKDIQGMSLVAASSGISVDQFALSLERLSFRLAGSGRGGGGGGTDVATGASRTQQTIEALVGSVKNASGQFLSPIDIFKKLADQFAAMPDGVEKTALATQLFGLRGAQLIPTLNKGSEAVQELIDKANALGISLDGEAEKATEYNTATKSLNLAWDALKQSIGDIVPFSLVTGAINLLAEALDKLSLGANKRAGESLGKALKDEFTVEDVDSLTKKGQLQADALRKSLEGAAAGNSLKVGNQRTQDPLQPTIDLFPKEQQQEVRLGIAQIYKDVAGVTDQTERTNIVTKEYLALVHQLADEGAIEQKNAYDITIERQKQIEALSRQQAASNPEQQSIQKFEAEVITLNKEVDKAEAKYKILSQTFSDPKAIETQRQLKDIIAQVAAVGDQPKAGTAAQNKEYDERRAAAKALLTEEKADIESLSKARETEISQSRAEALEEERRTQQVRRTIAAIGEQARAEVALAGNVGDSAAANRLAVASKDADLEIEKLLASAVDKRGQQIPAIIALIEQESGAIQANTAVKLVAADINKTADNFQAQQEKYNSSIKGLNDLIKAYQDGGAAIAKSVIGQKLEADARELQKAQEEYDLLAKKIQDIKDSGKTVSATPGVQGPLPNGGYVGDLQSQLDAQKKALDDLQAKYDKLYSSATTEAAKKLESTIVDQTTSFVQQIPYIDALNAAYLQNAEAVRKAEVNLKLFQFTQKEATRQGVDVTDPKLNGIINQERALLQGQSDDAHKAQVAREAEQYSLQAVYDKTITKLEEVKAAIIASGQSTLLVDAALYDAQNKYLKQLDDAALKIGTLKQKFGAFFQEMILAGQDFGQKVFASVTKAVDDLSTQIAAFVVTGKANFKSLFESLAQSIVKSGIQSLFGQISKGISGALHIDLPGGKPDGTQGNPLYVKSVDLPSAAAVTGQQAGATGPLDGIVGFFKNIFGGKSSTSVGTPPFVGDSTAPNVASPIYSSAGLFPQVDQSVGTATSSTGGGSIPLGQIIGGAGIGGAIGGAIGGTAGSIGGAIAGAGTTATIAAATGTAGAAAGSLSVLGPIGIAIGAALLVFGAISQKIKAKTAEIAKQISASFQTIVDNYNSGNINLITAIQQTEAARANAIATLSSKKGGQDQLNALLPQFDQQIAQLQAAQKQVLDTFNKLAVSLSFPQTLQGTIKSLQDLNDQVKQFLDAGGNAATAAQVFAASLNQIKGTTADSLLQSEQGIITAMLQENDLVKQRADLIKSTQDQINSVLFQGVLSRSQSEAQTKAAQIQTIRDNANAQLKSIDDQKSALDVQIDGQAKLFGLTTDVTTLKQTQLAIEKQISAEQAVQIAAEQKLLQQLQEVKAGATSVDLGGIATGQGSAANAQLQHDQNVKAVQDQISQAQVDLKSMLADKQDYSNQDIQDQRALITQLNDQLAKAIATPVVQQADTGVAASTDQTLANAISLALGGSGGLATAIATALKQIQGVILPNSTVSAGGGATFGNINIVVNGSNLTPDQLSNAIKDSLVTAYKSLQGNLQV